MKVLYYVGKVQLYLFGFIYWFLGIKILEELLGPIGCLIGLSPLAFIGPIYYFFKFGVDTRLIICAFSIILAVIGLLLSNYADDKLAESDNGSTQES